MALSQARMRALRDRLLKSGVLRWINPENRRGGPGDFNADLSCGCMSPVEVVLATKRWSPEVTRFVADTQTGVLRPYVGRGMYDASEEWVPHGRRQYLRLGVPCRRCEHCEARRRRMWRYRAFAEMLNAKRTWFGTLTASPGHHLRWEAVARARAAKGGVDWNSLSPEEQFTRLCAPSFAEVTKWLKRVRARSGAKLRYLLVVEKHEGEREGGTGENFGYPHFHLLVHECTGTVTWRDLDRPWPFGHTEFTLVDPDADGGRWKIANYVTVYITKSLQARIRASLHYGSDEGHSVLCPRVVTTPSGATIPSLPGVGGDAPVTADTPPRDGGPVLAEGMVEEGPLRREELWTMSDESLIASFFEDADD